MTFPKLYHGPEHPSHSEKVLLFYASVDSLDDNAEALATHWFDADEQHRLQQFRFARDRQLFLASHLLLRHVLGHYTNTAPAKLEFIKNRHGKPSLQPEPHMGFNLSHSGRIALLAVSKRKNIGVDVEETHFNKPLDEELLRFFSIAEQNHFRKLDPSSKTRHFYELWTLKESVVKATGRGLAEALDRFSVFVDDSGDVTLEAHSIELGLNDHWALVRLAQPTESSIASAVAVRQDIDGTLDCQSYWVELKDFSMAPVRNDNPFSGLINTPSD